MWRKWANLLNLEKWRAYLKFYASFVDKKDLDDKPFMEAAVAMVVENGVHKYKRMSKMICSEIIYHGQRHEVWLRRDEIFQLSWRCNKPYVSLAGMLKKRTLNLPGSFKDLLA